MKKGNVGLLLLILGISSFVIFFIGKNAIADTPSKVNATFETVNTAPSSSRNMSIQHYILGTPKAFDYFDFNDDGRGAGIADTHYVGGMPPNNGPSLNWSEGFDVEGHEVRTYLCISSTAALRNSAVPNLFGGSVLECDIVDKFGLGNEILDPPYVITQSAFWFNRTHENRTYFVRMISVENTAQRLLSSNYDTNISVVNTRPTMAFNFTTPDLPFPSSPEAHSRRPAIQWMPNYPSLDYDNGTSIDRWPGDNVTYLVTIQNISGSRIYLNSTSLLDNSFFNNPSKWAFDLDWGNIIFGGVVNSTYNFSIWANDSANLWSGPYNGQFNLADFVPDVQTVYMGDNFTQPTNCSNPGCFLTPTRHSNVTSLNVTVVVKDIDGDCLLTGPNEFNAYLHLCLFVPGNNCNEQTLQHNFTYYIDKVRFQAPDTCYFNFSTTPGPGSVTPAFFIEPSSLYRFYVNVTSQSGIKRPLGTDTESSGTWTYRQLLDAGYIDNQIATPYFETTNVTVGTPLQITPGSWSSGTNNYTTYNYGNVIFDTAWNTTKFVKEGGATGCGAIPFEWIPDDIYPIQVDDDPLQQFEFPGGIIPVNILGESPIRRFYYPGPGGLTG